MVSEDVVLRVAGAYGLPIADVKNFLFLIKDRIYVSDDVIALYFKLDDDTLDLLRFGIIDITDGNEVMRLFGLDGDNVHFVCCVGNARGVLSLRNFKGKSLSWFNVDMSKFVYFKRR